MFGRTRTFRLVIAFAAALMMLFLLSSVAFAGSTTTDDDTVCVDGYVINHREVPVDASKMTSDDFPELFVEAISADQPYSATVGSDGYFEFEELPAGMLNFKMELPKDWEGIVPLAERDAVAENGAVAETGMTEFDAQEQVLSDRLQDPPVVRRDGDQVGGAGWTARCSLASIGRSRSCRRGAIPS